LIGKELEYLEQLTDLQKLRFEESDFIELAINNQNSELKIVPLLLLPFVENAFKFVSNPEKLPAVKIRIDVKEKHVHFRCENYFDLSKGTSGEIASGIGLINARRRLELLYPDRFNLTINKTKNQFIVDLHLTSK